MGYLATFDFYHSWVMDSHTWPVELGIRTHNPQIGGPSSWG